MCLLYRYKRWCLGQSHWRGERQNPTLWAGYPHERPSKLFSDAVLGDILIIFSWEIHHSWTFRHSPLMDTQIQVNKELFTTDCPRVHLPFPFRLLPPSAFYILEVTHRSKHNSCCSWPQHPQPVSHLCSSTLPCGQGLPLFMWITVVHLCVILYSKEIFTYVIASDPE